MGLSRLENFLRSFRGNIIYVDPNALDSTDSIENDGTSAARPLKTIQRALIEAARFSHLPGLNNDKFGNTTILVNPGDHIIDNRPGWITIVDPLDATKAAFTLRSGQPPSRDFGDFDASTNFDITSDSNVLYKFNSVHGGVIVPRGTSIVGMDLRKTKIRPKYIPNPTDDSIERSAIFRLTGSCYLWQLSIFDGNPNGQVFYDYSQNKTVPNFSHHKLTVFEYADGVNNVQIDDTYIENFSANRTDLDMYYEKIGLAYGPPAREIKKDYPNPNIDIQTKLDEFRIVGSRGFEVNIANIFCGDNINPSSVATVELETPIAELDVDTAIRIDGVNVSEFNGQFVVKSVIDSTTIQYNLDSIPSPDNVNGGSNGTLNLVVDTVSSASPYIFNCSLRSVYGMCGLHADGSKADGFKSMVVAQYTGISLQKDNNAFVKYNQESASYNSINVENIATDSLARYKPTYQNYHIKASNNAFIQCVSVFAIGFSQHFLSESGGDQSITNSNSNFGAVSLYASGYQDSAFLRDDVGYITHIIPPKEIEGQIISVEYDQIDISLSKSFDPISPSRIFFYNRTDVFDSPKSVIDGYRIGAKIDDKLNVVISGITTSADIVMDGGTTSYEKSFSIQKLGSLNTISANIITLNSPHNFINGESVRVISKNGNLPEGIISEEIYYVITNTADLLNLTTSQIKLASSLNDALNATGITIYNTSSSDLTVVSRVSDKKCGEIGHPIQFDPIRGWYINVNPATNGIFNEIEFSFETSTARTYLTRVLGTRVSEDGIYKYRYVIPKDSTLRARPPSEGYVIQESSSTITGEDQIPTQFSIDTTNLTDSTQLRNLRLISGASWVSVSADSGIATINTEVPHNLSVGSKVKIVNIISENNTAGVDNSGFNGTFIVTSLPSSKSFRYSLAIDPGTFVDNTSTRSNTSPHYTRKNLSGTYLVYRSDKIQEYIQGKQDGVYHLIVTSSSNSPDVEPFTDFKFSQPIQNLYPQVDRDNPKSDPSASLCYASPSVIGEVLINNPENSITKEALDDYFKDYRIDFGISDIRSSSGIAHTIFTNIDHGLNPVVGLTVVSAGSNYGYGDGLTPTLYNARLSPTTSAGEGATAVFQITSGGSISGSNIKIMNGGSNYAVNDILTVVGVATTAGWVPATVRVTSVYNHIGETIQVTGTDVDRYNQLYNIIGITSSRILQVNSASTITTPISILGSTRTQKSNASLTGNSFIVTHTASGDVTTCTTTGSVSHGLQVGDKITFRRSDNVNLGDYIVRTVISLTSFTIGENIGNATSRVLPYKYSSTDGLISRSTESESARLVPNYAGITTTLGSPILLVNDDEITIPNVDNTGIKIGDYLEIDNEIVKVKQTVSGNPVLVFRGVFGTKKDTHELGAVVRKISPIPIEFRRNSILRASGHTFEYLGYGSGNYSTAFPDRQDRQLSTQEELLSQSFKSDGGSSIFTGMNSDGDFYIGNKRVSSLTGREEVFDTPIPTSRGEEITDETSLDVTSTSELNVSRRIRIDGGKENNIISEFGGPTVFNEKVTINNDIEANSIYLQGDQLVSTKYSVSEQIPTITGTPGDITFNSKPSQDGGSAGWTYTIENAWREFGPVQNELDRYVGIWSGRIIPSAGSTVNNGIIWDSNPGGGTGDFAFIQYYVQSGENTRLHIGIRNEADDDLYLEATQTTISNNLSVNGVSTFAASSASDIVTITQNGTGNALRVNDVSNDTTPFIINSGGLVGIGTTIPTQRLDVRGNVTITGDLYLGTQVNKSRITYTTDVARTLIIPSLDGTRTFSFIQQNEVITGIKTFSTSSTSDIVTITQSGTGNALRVNDITNDTTPFVVDAIGSVGIGTTRATTNIKLDVRGNTSITGNLTVTGNTTLGDVDTDTLTVNATSTFSSPVTFTGITSFSSNVNINSPLELYQSGGAYIDFKQNPAEDYNVRLDNFTSNVLRLSSLVGNAELRVTGDIIAFVSDERLKTNIKSIENALDKVVTLNGFTYTFNELAESLGFDPNQQHVGVSAQQVQSVLPEAIALCPANEDYLTVKYEKIVPLLIEAIKELKNEIDELKKNQNK